jgi:hypothetical protein
VKKTVGAFKNSFLPRNRDTAEKKVLGKEVAAIRSFSFRHFATGPLACSKSIIFVLVVDGGAMNRWLYTYDTSFRLVEAAARVTSCTYSNYSNVCRFANLIIAEPFAIHAGTPTKPRIKKGPF